MLEELPHIKEHYNSDRITTLKANLALEEMAIKYLIIGYKVTVIAELLGISISKVSRIKKLNFPTLPTPARDGSIALEKERAQRARWRELNERDKRIVRMLQTQSYEEVAKKNNVSIGTIHNLAHYHKKKLQNRKIKRKAPNRGMKENQT